MYIYTLVTVYYWKIMVLTIHTEVRRSLLGLVPQLCPILGMYQPISHTNSPNKGVMLLKRPVDAQASPITNPWI